MSGPVDVLAVLGAAWKERDGVTPRRHWNSDNMREACAAVAELIEAATYATCGSACPHNRCAKLRAAIARVKGVQP